MSKAFGAARRAAFLRALAETGNFTLAAARAKVSRSWVTLHRAEDPAFRAAGDAAVAAARERLIAGAESTQAPAKWGLQGGAALVVRGTNGRRVQIAQARVKQWDPAAEARFLQTLKATCNVKAACAAVGLTQASAYGHRKRWPRFADRWDDAIGEGAMRLEVALLENGGNVFEGVPQPDDMPFPPMTVMEALLLLSLNQKRLYGTGKAPGREPRRKTLDELAPQLIRRVEATIARRGLSEADRAEAQAEWDAIAAGQIGGAECPRTDAKA